MHRFGFLGLFAVMASFTVSASDLHPKCSAKDIVDTAVAAKLPKATVETLLKPENKDKLVAFLKYHVVSDKVMAADVINVKEAKALLGLEWRRPS
jgi:uncharacterized surface protein with fasciclin (FAS1) repeats